MRVVVSDDGIKIIVRIYDNHDRHREIEVSPRRAVGLAKELLDAAHRRWKPGALDPP
jgi:hypothetical protein